MIIVKSINGVGIRLSQERWNHIIRRHPEIENQKPKIVEAITEPEIIQKGDFGELIAIRFYPKTPLTKKYLVVAYKETDKNEGFIITAYFAQRPSKRRAVLWKR